MSPSRKHPIDYRQREVGYVMERWRASESSSLVGVGSVGKSNLMRHLADPDVQRAYMDKAHVDSFRAIIIDPSLLTPLPQHSDANAEQIGCWAGYELMLHRLFLAFHRTDVLDEDDALRFQSIYETLQDGRNPLYSQMGLRYFELGLQLFMEREIHIVFMFDEFEEMLRHLPVKFFLTLRGLRDTNKKYLSYLTFTRTPLPDVVRREGIDPLAIEQFIELFTDNVFYVGPFSERDGRKMIRELEERNQRAFDQATQTFLLWSTGMFPGLLRSTFRILSAMEHLDATTVMTQSRELAQDIARRNPVRSECHTIWASLNDAERYVLRVAVGLANFERSDESTQAVELLVQKRLLRIDDNQLLIEPPLFAAYVAYVVNET